MEIIRNYLESMFASLPNTPEVIRAKDELYSMMEDKYNELLAEGKAENEAVSIVIAEFGNLDELAESLGINRVMEGYEEVERTLLTYDQADAYVFRKTRSRLMLGIGVMLIIFCPIGGLIADFKGVRGAVTALVSLFILLAAGIGLIIYSSVMMNKWDFLNNYPCYVDYATSERLMLEKQNYRPAKALYLITGIALCILSVVPVIIFEQISAAYFLTDGVGPALIFVMVGIGVMLIIYSGGREAGINRMLNLNDAETVSGGYSSKDEDTVRYSDPRLDSLMDSYWSIITCAYLIWSFLTFDWHISWIIWPIAGIVKPIIEGAFGTDSKRGRS